MARPFGIFAFFALIVSVWGGLAPFVGPAFGFTGAGGGSFQRSLARAVWSALSAIAGVAGALLVLGARATGVYKRAVPRCVLGAFWCFSQEPGLRSDGPLGDRKRGVVSCVWDGATTVQSLASQWDPACSSALVF
jgi:hypothetical protein